MSRLAGRERVSGFVAEKKFHRVLACVNVAGGNAGQHASPRYREPYTKVTFPLFNKSGADLLVRGHTNSIGCYWIHCPVFVQYMSNEAYCY